MEGLLIAIGVMIISAAAGGLLARYARQPLLIGYVLAGVLLGPAMFNYIKDPEPILLLSELGLIFLLFIIGIELDLSRIKDVGIKSISIGITHVVVITAIGTGASVALGTGFMQGIYIGLLVAISSTIVVAKLMQDKRETSSLHGEIIMGILVVEDLLAVLGLALLSSLGPIGPVEHTVGLPTLKGILEGFGAVVPHTGGALVGSLIIQGILFVCVSYLFLTHISSRLFKVAIQFHELFFVLSIATVFVLSGLASFFGFSFAIGAFAAGLALSSARQSHEIMARIGPLKDFFLILFFVGLGTEVAFSDVGNQYGIIAIVIVGAMLIKPIELYAITRMFKYNIRTSFLVAIHLAQASEFGLILLASGVIAGVIPFSVLSAAVLATIITMVLSTYAIEYEQRTYELLRPFLLKFTRDKHADEEEIQNIPALYAPEIVFFGVTSVTSELIHTLKKRKILVVDYNPERAIDYEKKGIPTICSDAIDPELYATVDFTKTKVVVSVIHDTPTSFHGPSSNRFLIKKIIGKSPDATVIVTARDEREAERFYKAGASLALTPHMMGRRVLTELLTDKKAELVRLCKECRQETLRHLHRITSEN